MTDTLIDESKYDTLPEPTKDRFCQPPIIREQIYPGDVPPQIPPHNSSSKFASQDGSAVLSVAFYSLGTWKFQILTGKCVDWYQSYHGHQSYEHGY